MGRGYGAGKSHVVTIILELGDPIHNSEGRVGTLESRQGSAESSLTNGDVGHAQRNRRHLRESYAFQKGG